MVQGCLRVLCATMCIAVFCELSSAIHVRGDSSHKDKVSTTAVADQDEPTSSVDDDDDIDDELDALFNDDKFFTEFDHSVKQRKQLVSSTASVAPERVSTSAPATQAFSDTINSSGMQGKLDAQEFVPTLSSISSSPVAAAGAAISDCRTGQKTFLDSANDGFTSVTDAVLGLIGLSTMQTSIYPIIMILVAGVTGIFWAVVFWYLYTNFFTGGGYFGGEGGGSEGFGFGDFLKTGKFKENKYKYNNYSPTSAYGQSRYNDIDWDYYTRLLGNLASYGWDKVVDSYVK